MLVFVDCAAEPVVAADVQPGETVRIGDRGGQRAERCGLIYRLVGTAFVVVEFELLQTPAEVVLIPDQRAVEEFAAYGTCVKRWRIKWATEAYH